MIEPGPVNTEFEMKLMTEVSKKEFVGADAETLHHFRTCYLPTQVNLFQVLGQTPEDIAKVRTHMNYRCNNDYKHSFNNHYNS